MLAKAFPKVPTKISTSDKTPISSAKPLPSLPNTPVTCDSSSINIKGKKTFDLLSSGSPFNFNNFRNTKNSVTQTLLNHIDVIIHHTEINEINLFVRRSFLEDLWLWIKDSARFV